MKTRRLAALGTLALTLALVGGINPAQAAFESDYSTRATVSFGAHEHAQLPVTLELPAPASGGAITAVTAQWRELVPQDQLEPQPTTTLVRQPLDVSTCTAELTCELSAVLPTAGMTNGTQQIAFFVSNSEGPVGTVNRTTAVRNPKPTVSFTSPQSADALWGDVTLSADAAAATDSGAAPLKGVRFYVDGDTSADAPYLFDDTASYAVTLPATDIASEYGSRYLVVVAEDTDGNLSLMPPAAEAASVRRRVSVGPAPLVNWTSPQTAGTISGSMRRGVSLEFRAALPDSAPARPGQPSDPYIAGYDVFLDGSSLGSSNWNQPTAWNNYQAGTKLRAIDGWWTMTAASGLTSGRHTVTVRVRTSYGGVATLTSDILVADGVSWGQVTTAGQVVDDGYVVTAGSLHRFTAPASTRVAGTSIDWPDVQTENQDLYMQGWPCASTDPSTCPAATVVQSDIWAAPDEPGTVTLTFTAQAHDDLPDTITRTLTVQPAARLSLDVSRHLVRRGKAVSLTGRLTRADNGAPQAHRTVWVQWRRSNNLNWHPLAVRTTDSNGLVHYRTKPTASGYFRLRSPEVRGTIGTGISSEEKVFLSH